MSAFTCSEGHDFAAPKAPKRCPYCPGGKPCAGTVGVPAVEARAELSGPVVQAVKAGDPLEVLHTGRWYRVDAARLLRSRVEVRFTTGTGPRLKKVELSALRGVGT